MNNLTRQLTRALGIGFALMISGCGDFAQPTRPSNKSTSAIKTAEIEHPEGDPTVSPEDGGPGFTGEGWLTSEPGYLGDPKAVKGGAITTDVPHWPGTLRMYGKTYNTQFNYVLGWRHHLMYQCLVETNPNTNELMPQLASHWWISEDKQTFRFRIDPKAHWSDGAPVTSQDVIATFNLARDETLLSPAITQQLSVFDPPKAISKYIIEVHANSKKWINFHIFGELIILPAHEIEGLTGDEYLDKFNYKYTAVTGPYLVQPQDIKENESITLTRRADFWAKDYKRNVGRYNFDKIRFVVVRDQRLSFEKVCKGELDYQASYTAKWFVEDALEQPSIQNGWLIRRKIFTQAPNGISGLAFNMRESPLDDVRVRKAIRLLYPVEQLVEKFAYNEYLPIDSIFPGAVYANPDNEKLRYNPDAAVNLLESAGWTERGPDGIRVKDGKRLSLTILYRTPGLEKYYTSLKESCLKAGVEINLSETTGETQFKSLMDRKFQVASMAWGADTWPNPEAEWHSAFADKIGSNNFVGFKSAKVDELIEQYNVAFDPKDRIEILKQIDGLITAEVPYSLGWYLPNQRMFYWDKFGMPEYGLHRFSEWDGFFGLWWIDPEKEKKLKEARRSGAKLTPPPIEQHYWGERDLKQAKAN